jgi:hypothetical protein
MANFKNSLSVGVEAAKVAAENKREIDELIQDVNRQVEEAYDGKVHFGVWNLTKRVRRNDAAANIFMDVLNFVNVEYKGLCITNYDNKEPISLVEWKVSENGYPCIIKYDDREAYCYDKDDLISEFSTLLSDIKTGKAILKQLDAFSEKGKAK